MTALLLTSIVSVLTVSISALVSVRLWYLSQKDKREHEKYLRKLDLYKELMVNLEAFYVRNPDIEKRAQFITDSRIAWLYASDEVLVHLIAFLESMDKTNGTTDEQRNDAFNALVKAIRVDLGFNEPEIRLRPHVAKN